MGGNFMHTLFNKPTRRWFQGAGDTVLHGISSGVDKGIAFSEHQMDSVTGIFSSPTFLIVAGVVVVALIMFKKP